MPRLANYSALKEQNQIDFPQRKPRSSTRNNENRKLRTNSDISRKTTERETASKNENSKIVLSPRKRAAIKDIENEQVLKSPKKSANVENDEVFKSPKKSERSPLAVISPNCKTPCADAVCKPLLNTPLSAKRQLILARQSSVKYTKVRQALHTSIPDQLVSRKQELETIRKFLDTSINQSISASMYMSGAPGTGKTACLTRVLSEMECQGCKKLQTMFVNCMSLKHSRSIYSKLANIITSSEKTMTEKEALKELEKKFTSKGPKILLVLDEIDQLESKNQEILYKLFEMPYLAKSRLTLVGIANALDLTDRILPRLHSSSECQPLLLQFSPYSKEEITQILMERVKEINTDIIDPTAIHFCARKVSAMSGDARKALDILRRAVEIVETDIRRQSVLTPDENDKQTSTKKKKVTLAHISSVCSDVYGSRLSQSDGSNATFPLQQKVLVCSLMVAQKDLKQKDTTMGKLHEIYSRICKSRQISQISYNEFASVCSLLESRGLLAIKKAKDQRSSKVSLRLQESEIEHALQDKTLLSSIIAAGIPKE